MKLIHTAPSKFSQPLFPDYPGNLPSGNSALFGSVGLDHSVVSIVAAAQTACPWKRSLGSYWRALRPIEKNIVIMIHVLMNVVATSVLRNDPSKARVQLETN